MTMTDEEEKEVARILTDLCKKHNVDGCIMLAKGPCECYVRTRGRTEVASPIIESMRHCVYMADQRKAHQETAFEATP